MELFWAKGYDGTSMTDLTEAMGINAPSLYAAFGCKEALFREAIALYGETEGGRIWDSVKSAPSRADRRSKPCRRAARGSSHARASRRVASWSSRRSTPPRDTRPCRRSCRSAPRRRAAQSAPRRRVWPGRIAVGHRPPLRRDILRDGPARHVDPGARRRFAQNPSRRRRLCHGRVGRSRRFPAATARATAVRVDPHAHSPAVAPATSRPSA